MADDFTYYAITIIPNFLVTGVLAVIVSTMSCEQRIFCVNTFHRIINLVLNKLSPILNK
jgi:hypothetical protein